MGAYLSEPVVDKLSNDEISGELKLSYGASCMQGWRISQEVKYYIYNYRFVFRLFHHQFIFFIFRTHITVFCIMIRTLRFSQFMMVMEGMK